jgi:hypothetical protein
VVLAVFAAVFLFHTQAAVVAVQAPSKAQASLEIQWDRMWDKLKCKKTLMLKLLKGNSDCHYVPMCCINSNSKHGVNKRALSSVF